MVLHRQQQQAPAWAPHPRQHKRTDRGYDFHFSQADVMILLSVHGYHSPEHTSYQPVLASLIMADDEKEIAQDPPAPPPSMRGDWGSGFGSGRTKLFASPDDFDIYCDREKSQNYIFHRCELDCTIDHMEYNPETQRITVFTNDGQKLDLGAKIQWLVRPYIAREQNIFIIRTKDGKGIDGVEVHLTIKKPEKS